MSLKFNPHYSITPKIAQNLMLIEAAKEKIQHLPLTPTVLATLRETARLQTTHYSTMIEGNQLEPFQVATVIQHQGHFPGRERDEKEVKGYYAALNQVEQWAAKGSSITEHMVQKLHALVVADGKTKVEGTSYRDGQNVIRDARTHAIVYLPPEAKDVSGLMQGLIEWIRQSSTMPCPIVAGIAHYQFATIHPYYDGNGRTARLLTTLILHLGGYDLKGLYSLEEYYARNLDAYYNAISIGPSHNYYLGRDTADITSWVEYFVEGMATSCHNVLNRMNQAETRGEKDYSPLLRKLDPKQRKTIELFQSFEVVTASQIGALFGFSSRASSGLCKLWVDEGFLEIAAPSKKARKYRLAAAYTSLI